MGLVVQAFEKVSLVRACSVAEAGTERIDEERDDVVLVYSADGFELRADGLADGFYEYDGGSHEISVGSCGHYGKWRSALAKLVGTTDVAIWANPKPGPFVELINFSDCDGFIGPKTSAKLAADFETWADRAQLVGGDFAATYDEFREAFDVAARDGIVKFH